MKKVLVFITVLVIMAMPLAAKTTLLNLGYNIHNDFWGIDDLHLRSIGLSVSTLKNDDAGLYAQVNPYYGLSFKNISVAKLSDYDETLIGSNFIVGYGGDLNFGSMGLLLGGGLFSDLFYYDYGYSSFTVSAGFGFAANLYFQPGSGNIVINAGIMAAISPWTFYIIDSNSDNYTNWGQSTVNLNIGIGWRTGGNSGKSNRSSSSSGGDDW